MNGKTWPYLDVEPRQYRFRLLNGSNARFYDLTLEQRGAPFIAIATDDGYLANAVSTPNVIIGPGERYEVIVDFSGVFPGTQIVMKNSAGTPFPGGDPADRGYHRHGHAVQGGGRHIRLAEHDHSGRDPDQADRPRSRSLDAHIPATGSITRQLTLNEVISADGPLELVVNNSKYNLKSYDPRRRCDLSLLFRAVPPRSAAKQSFRRWGTPRYGKLSTSPPTRTRCTSTSRVSSFWIAPHSRLPALTQRERLGKPV